MKNKKQQFLFAIFAAMALFLLVLAHQGLAQTNQLENTYPTIPGVQTPTSANEPLPNLLKYIYNFSILAAGVLAFILMVWGGIKYMTSVNNPGKMTDAREQISVALVGMLLIFGSYLIVNTINPDLTRLTIFLPSPSPLNSLTPLPGQTGPPELKMTEVPVGALITSEFLASSFLSTTSPDIDYAKVDWPSATTSTSTYSTDFQGALFGARLRRIYEVASTTVPVAKKLSGLSDGLRDLINECNCWANCTTNSSLCSPVGGACSCRIDQSPCSDETKKKIETEIKELDYLEKAFMAFLNPGSLVKDYYDSNKSEIDNLKDKEIKDLIQSMVDVENKGTYTPKTDPLERDIGQSLIEMMTLLDAMKKVKRQLNPYNQEEGYQNLMSYAEAATLEQEMNVNAVISSYYTFFPLNGLEEVNAQDDPATFYSAATLDFPYGPPSTEEQIKTPEPDFFKMLLPLMQDNVAWAQSFSPPPPVYDPEAILGTSGTCNHIVEIPIGKALDEAIKLGERINGQLFEIFLKGYLAVLRAEIDKSIANTVKNYNCQEACISPYCFTFVFMDIPLSMCTYLPPIPAPTCFIPGALLVNQIGLWAIDSLIGDPAKDVETAFKKLDSQEPIGKDYCCPDKTGNCRTNNNTKLDVGKLKEREYTLKEKLIEVQKLLNRSRELVDPQGGKSKYDLLLEDLIKLKLADKGELTFIQAEDKLDLQNCHVFYETLGMTETIKSTKGLINCLYSESLSNIDRFDPEACSQDPYLDCDYFNAVKTRDRRPISCYCYDENADQSFYNSNRFPEIYHTTLNIKIPDLSSGVTLENLPDLLGILLGTRIEIGTFLGFGNNFYCCVKDYGK